MTEFTTWRSLVDGEGIIAIPDSSIDNFEWGGPVADRYEGATSEWEINTDNPILSGDFSLKQTGSSSDLIFATESTSDDEPPVTKSQDDTPFNIWRAFGDELPDSGAGLIFGLQDSNNFYKAQMSNDSLRLRKSSNGSFDDLASTTFSAVSNGFYKIEVAEWGAGSDNDEITIRVEDESENEIATITGTDSEFENETAVGIRSSGAGGHVLDGR